MKPDEITDDILKEVNLISKEDKKFAQNIDLEKRKKILIKRITYIRYQKSKKRNKIMLSEGFSNTDKGCKRHLIVPREERK